MGEAVRSLEAKVELARVYVPAYVRMVDGSMVKVDGHWRRWQRRRRLARGEGSRMQRQVDMLLGDENISQGRIDSFLDRMHRSEYAEILRTLDAVPDPDPGRWLANKAAARRLLRTIAGLESGPKVTEIDNKALGHGGSVRTHSLNAPTGVA